MNRQSKLDKLQGLRRELIALANDPIGMDDYKSQMRRYQILLLGIIDIEIECVVGEAEVTEEKEK